ncbi:ectoine/hydroxyectoine ABC transporter permease subunit EhuD [Mycobacterium aquaticum]|uniref:Ectoine/hydroxyectoine ABC transporter permease subunit EhuD n=1 Tax=Mycobacterium aquaticum TaxID=1927124 RepID=A0A1X0B5P8_9MYCO|nr:ectoine/hydroxyectoine ABC transporter permease subunit EhuD [Mycobacterium aquaticum]ORA37176.1 ectoine/hydroxyectoine ABC transporter permease subunit EhuD [Mycobacterium aquaticum]
MTWDWAVAQQAFPYLVKGLWITVLATVAGSVLAMVLGAMVAVLRRSPHPAVALPIKFTVEFIRGTPLLVQLFFLYYVLPHYGIMLSAWVVGVLALGIHYSTYLSEVYRSGLDGLPAGQWEACTALGLSTRVTWFKVVLPQVVRSVLPAMGNYTIGMFKETPLLSAITVAEMMTEAKLFADEHYRYLEPFTMVGIIFLVLSLTAALALRRLENRLAL